MKKSFLFLLGLFFIISIFAFGELNVRKLNEELTLNNSFRIVSWDKTSFNSSNVGSNTKYIDSWFITYRKVNNGIEQHMAITYKPSNNSSKGHWQGEVLDIDLSVNNLLGGGKISFKSLNEMSKNFIKYNNNKKQNNILQSSINTPKDKNGVMIINLPTQKGVMVSF